MSESKEIYAIVEGPTEQKFITEVLAPYLATKNKNVFLRAAFFGNQAKTEAT